MDLGLAGKKALVTGSTKGIGRAVAEALLAEGASVAICARNGADVDRALGELSAAGTAVGSAVDAGDLGSLEAWIASSAEALGGIDVYVHNTSGKGQRQLDDWTKNFDVDLRALVGGVAAAADALADGGGSLVSIGTTATAEHFGPGSGSYSAFKAAVTNWTLGQAQVLGARGIRCNVVSPGPIFVEGGDWDRIKGRMPEFFEATQRTHPGGAMGTAQDVANAVAFLASDAARHHQWRQPHRRRRVPQACRLLRRPPGGASTPAWWRAASTTTSTSPASSCSTCWPSTPTCAPASTPPTRTPRRWPSAASW